MKHGAAGTRVVRAYLQGPQEVPADSPGRSVLTEPIGSVLRFLKNFGSWKTGTVRFFSKLRTEKLWVWFFRFGSGYNRKNRTPRMYKK